MIQSKFRRHSYNQSLKLIPFLTVVVMMFLSSCIETRFLEYPESHRLLNEIQKWPDEYYWNIETGVFSRVLGNSTVEQSKSLLTQMVQDWDAIVVLDTSEKLINYFQEHNLFPIAEAIQETLIANAEQESTGELNSWLQAKAIKVGLINAYDEIMKNTSG
jgi:hypothetical protein